MAEETVRIESLHLRLPGLSREEAERVGAEVARLLADALPESERTVHLGALHLRTSVPANTPGDQLAERIARTILESLR